MNNPDYFLMNKGNKVSDSEIKKENKNKRIVKSKEKCSD